MNKKYMPLVFWGWNASLKNEEIELQIKDFADKGIGGIFIHARVGLDIDYLGKEWMDAYQVTIDCCQKYGLSAWIYDEYGWPSGFAGGAVFNKSDDYKEKRLLSFYGTLSELLKSNVLEKDIIGAYILENDAFVKANDYQIGTYYFIYQKINDYYVDILDCDAVDYFIEYTFGKYQNRFEKYFGNVIQGVFTDEPHVSPDGIPYGRFMPTSFIKEFGYPLDEALPYMFYNVGEYSKHRFNFWKNISLMFSNNYVKKYNDWCQKHNLILTGHFACEDGLVDQVSTSGSMMQLYENMGQIGVDALGNRLVPPCVYKQASSVSRQINSSDVLCETYAGSGYDASLKDIIWIWGYQASLGVNIPCLSISMYSIAGQRKRDYPQYFSYQMPWWEKADDIFNSMTNINNMLTEGKRKAEFLVVHPIESVWAERGFNIIDKSMHISSEFRILTESLIDLQVEFDYGDEELMKKYARVENDKFIIGNVSYSKIILPYMTTITSNTLNLLKQFSQNGGQIFVVNEYPKYVDGKDANIKEMFDSTFVINRRDFLRKAFSISTTYDVKFLKPSIRFEQSGLSITKRYFDDKIRVFAVNLSRDDTTSTRLTSIGHNEIIKIDIFGNKTILPSFYNEHDDITYTSYVFEPKEPVFFEIVNGANLINEKQVVSMQKLDDFLIDIGDNVLTIDKVKVYADGLLIGDEDYTIKQTAPFYKAINGLKKNTNLKLEYRFYATKINGNIRFCGETFDSIIKINGNQVFSNGYQWDKDFKTFEIGNYIIEGENIVTLEKEISPFYSEYLDGEIYQSISNVLSFPFYFENVYLLGNFDVICQESTIGDNCIWANGFSITGEIKDKNIKNLVTSNMFFYAGKTTIAKTIDIDDLNYDYHLLLKEANACIISIFVNGVEFKSLNNYVNITNQLKIGSNEIKIVLYSGFRNTLGPLHHIYGKHYYVGPSVFAGYKEWQDIVMFSGIKDNTWTDDYAFVAFGIEEILLEKSKKW